MCICMAQLCRGSLAMHSADEGQQSICAGVNSRCSYLGNRSFTFDLGNI